MKKITLFVDMHGVLINSDLMIKNYEKVLIKLYGKYDIQDHKAIDYHNKGLDLYQTLLGKSKRKFLSGDEFLLEMSTADKKWDNLMQNFVLNKEAHEIESRNVEYLAGSYSDTFYEDGKKFLSEIIVTSEFDYFFVSNAHSKHIKGLLNGAGFNSIPSEKILGWDRMKALKNNKIYYDTLLTEITSPTNTNIFIGNSKDEMVYAKERGFKTIFVKREFTKNYDFKDWVDLEVDNLESILEKIQYIFNKYI